jgi:uncharacterized protein (DUF342 family)
MISESLSTEPELSSANHLPSLRPKPLESNLKALRRKTMLSERSNFLHLKRSVLQSFPQKKFNACAASEFSKLILNRNQVTLSGNYSAKYSYPAEVLSTSQIYRVKHARQEDFALLKTSCYKAQVCRVKTLNY